MADGNIVSIDFFKGQFAGRFVFANQAELYYVTNSYVPFSPHWNLLLEELIQVRVQGFDAVVVGWVNHCTDDGVQQMAQDFQIDGLQCTNSSSPEIKEWMDVYKGRLLFFTPFFQYGKKKQKQWATDMIHLKRNNTRKGKLGYVYGRQHIEQVGHEGSSKNPTGDVDPPNSGKDGHRCVGRFGGYPDLAAWDVVEWLFEGRDSFNNGIDSPFIKKILKKNGGDN